MSQTESDREFAFGRNGVDNCACPAITAGMNPCGSGADHYPGLVEAAEWYDSIMKKQESSVKGTISEDVAKDAWVQVIQKAIEQDLFEAQAAIEVAIELGWVDKGDYQL